MNLTLTSTENLFKKINQYLDRLSNKKKEEIYKYYKDEFIENENRTFTIHPHSDVQYSNYYDEPYGECQIEDMYDTLENRQNDLYLLSSSYNYYDKNNEINDKLKEMSEIVNIIKENNEISSKVIIIFAYILPGGKYLDLYLEQITKRESIIKYIEYFTDEDINKRVCFYLYVCPKIT